jgi:hypothetical protein
MNTIHFFPLMILDIQSFRSVSYVFVCSVVMVFKQQIMPPLLIEVFQANIWSEMLITLAWYIFV